VLKGRGRRRDAEAPSTIRLWVSERRLEAHKIGGRKWLVRRSELNRLLASRTNTAPHRPSTVETTPADADRD